MANMDLNDLMKTENQCPEFLEVSTKSNLPYDILKTKIENQVDFIGNENEFPRKRGRPRNTDESLTRLKRIRRLTSRKNKSSQAEKANHELGERERRKNDSILLDELRKFLPAYQGDSNAPRKKILEEATDYLRKQNPIFLAFLREKQKYYRLMALRQKLVDEITCTPQMGETVRTREDIEEAEMVRLLELTLKNVQNTHA